MTVNLPSLCPFVSQVHFYFGQFFIVSPVLFSYTPFCSNSSESLISYSVAVAAAAVVR